MLNYFLVHKLLRWYLITIKIKLKLIMNLYYSICMEFFFRGFRGDFKFELTFYLPRIKKNIYYNILNGFSVILPIYYFYNKKLSRYLPYK